MIDYGMATARPPPTRDFLRATQQQTSNIFTYIFSFIFRFSYLLNYPKYNNPQQNECNQAKHLSITSILNKTHATNISTHNLKIKATANQ